MAASNTDVCNSALVKLGVYPLISALSDNTKPAILCNSRYQYIVDELLRLHPWNFAKKRTSLALSVTVPNYYYLYQFPLPADFVRILDIGFGLLAGTTTQYPDDWALESGNIMCFSTTCNIMYIYKNYDTTTWDQLFEESVAWRLAADIGYGLTQSSTLVQSCYQAYQKTLDLARSMNAQDRGSVQQVQADDWMQIRGGMWSDPSRF